MANFYGLNATKQLVTVPAAAVPVGEANGVVRLLYDKFSVTAALTTSDVLYMGSLLPKGAKVLEVMVKSADLGTTGAFNIGWQASAELSAGSPVVAASATGFFSALDVNSAADVQLASQLSAAPSGILKDFAAAVQVVIVPSTATTATSGDIEIAITYVVD